MRIGIIGTSAIAGHFVEGARLAGGIDIAAVYSRSLETGRLSRANGRFPLSIRPLTRWQRARPWTRRISPARMPFTIRKASGCLPAEKHVLCEKPIVTAPEQFDELCAFAAEKGLVYMEAIMMRYLPAREILHKAMGQIGRISAARFDFSQLSSRYPALLKGEVPNIFNPAMAAGSLMDLGVYCVYPAIDLFGEPERVRASAGFLSTGADGFGSACLSYPEREVLLSWSKIGQGYAGSEILGDQGSITIQSISMLAGMELHLPDGTRRTLCGLLNKAEAMRGETEAFCRFTQEPGRFWLDAARAVELTSSVCRVMEQIRREAGISFGKLPL